MVSFVSKHDLRLNGGKQLNPLCFRQSFGTGGKTSKFTEILKIMLDPVP